MTIGRFYTYAHRRNTDGKVFYIGKGRMRTAYGHRWESA